MDFEIGADDIEFRERTRRFLRSKMEEIFGGSGQGEYRVMQSDREAMQRWTRALDEGGYLVYKWPSAHGGAEWSATWPRILESEMTAANCPFGDVIGVGFVGPLLCKFGSQEQKQRYLRRIRSGEDCWCQGFSEPHAGSDTMSIRTSAVRDKGAFIINGQKLWTTNAHQADMMFALVRTKDAGGRIKPGLTFLLLSMRSEGVTVRPVILIDGLHRVNEVTLDNVRVPITNMVGEEGKGWLYAQSLLADERTIVAGLGQIRMMLRTLRRALSSEQTGGRNLLDQTDYRTRLAKLEVEFEALEFMELRFLHMKAGASDSRLSPSMLKLRGSELRQRVTEFTFEVLGETSMEVPGTSRGGETIELPPSYAAFATISFLFQRAATILGGTSEVQRNLIAGVGLGM